MQFSTPYNQQDYISFFRDEFLPEDFQQETQNIDIDFQSRYFKQITYFGKSESLDLAVYEIRHTSENDARIGLSRDAFKMVSHYFENNALILFVPENETNYRLSLVTIEHKLDAKGIRVFKEFSNPKRYSYYLGLNSKTHTPEQYLIGLGRVTNIDDLKKRFSVEVVNKEFYSKIAEMFSKLVGGKRKRGVKTLNYTPQLQLPSYPIEKNEQKYKEFAVRLIGRTVFCWFLKKKKSNAGISLIPEDVLSHFAVNMYPDYYHARVEPLFFEVLNTPTDKRKQEYKQDPYILIPFLNGGLFEPHHDDFYVAGKSNYALKIPDEWWKEFFDILETYNFTIDENTSIDIDLSVDPEMLGRIFENLLAEINPETGETARKSTGSYYTPRPIVEYMVDESLKQHIITKTNLPEEKIVPLLDYSIEKSGLTPDEETKVKAALDDIKVLDPACGSGAFPMGILQKMLLILQKVDHRAENSIKNILKDIKDPIYRKLFEAKLMEDDDLDDYARKLSIIRRSIFGIDIQPIATEISKLRFFLSIIVDEKIQDDQKNRGIEPLPNLEFKFACANTLIPLPANRELFENADAIEQLENLREEYFVSYGSDKKNIKAEFQNLQKKLFTENINLFNRDIGEHNLEHQTQSSLLATWNPFGDESTPWFDAKWMFGVADGFDIVIGNPPWGSKSCINVSTKNRNKEIIVRMVDSFMFFINESSKQTKDFGNCSFIVPDVILYQADNLKLRDKLISKNRMLHCINLGDFVFNEVTRASCLIAFKKEIIPTYNFIVGSFHNNYKKLNYSDLLSISNKIPQLLPNNTIPTENIEGFKLLIKNLGESLIDFLDEDGIQRGISPDYKSAFILDKNCPDLSIIETQIQKPTITGGKDMVQFRIPSPTKVILYISKETNSSEIPNAINYISRFKDFITCKEVLQNKHPFYTLHRPREIKVFEKEEKVLGVITGDKLKVALDKNKIFPTDGIYLLAANSKTSNTFLVGYLNSKLATFFYNMISNEKGKILAQIKPNLLKNIPFKANCQFEQQINRTVNEIMNLPIDHRSTENSELYKILNISFYKLYSLTYEEVLIVDPKFTLSREEYEAFEIE